MDFFKAPKLQPLISDDNFSFLNLFYLPAGEHNAELRTKLRQIGAFYWACLLFPPYFIAEQAVSFHTTRYWPILIPMYVLIVISPLIYRKTVSFHFYAGYLVTFGVGIVIVITACAGGNRSPGAFWMVGAPMVFGLFYGKRGVWIGAAVMACSYVGFVLLNSWQMLPNLVAEFGNYEQVKIINLIGFGIYNVIISYYFIHIEEKAKNELRLQKQETDSLLRIMVHDVTNPINAFRLMSLAAKSGRKEPSEVLMLADDALDELSAIVQQVSKLRALKDGKLAMQLEPVQVQSALGKVIGMMLKSTGKKEVKIQQQFEQEAVYVLVDKALFKNVVLANLISNAIKFSHPGQAITIQMAVTQTVVTITVTDQGIGMSDSLLQKIFDPTEPTTRPGTIGERGTGYGLPLVKMIMSKFNGDIQVVSSQDPENGGTQVTIKLPRHMP